MYSTLRCINTTLHYDMNKCYLRRWPHVFVTHDLWFAVHHSLHCSLSLSLTHVVSLSLFHFPCSQGDFTPLREWLRTNVHEIGTVIDINNLNRDWLWFLWTLHYSFCCLYWDYNPTRITYSMINLTVLYSANANWNNINSNNISSLSLSVS